MTLHNQVMPAMANAADTVLPDSLLHVYPTGPVIALSGLVIAGAGAIIPAILTARLKTTENLRTE